MPKQSYASQYATRVILGAGMTDGKFLMVTATTLGAAQTLHVHSRGARFERLRVDAWNNTGTAADLHLQWVGVASPNDEVVFSVPAKAGPIAIVPDWLLVKGGAVKVYTPGGANVINLYVEASEQD